MGDTYQSPLSETAIVSLDRIANALEGINQKLGLIVETRRVNEELAMAAWINHEVSCRTCNHPKSGICEEGVRLRGQWEAAQK